MAEGVEKADGCDGASDDCEQLPDEFVELRLMLAVHDVDGLDLCHEHKLGERLIRPGGSSPQRISVILTARLLLVPLDHHWDNLYMVQEIDSSFLSRVVLNHCSVVDISLEILNIVLDVLGLMGDREVEDVVA